MNYSAETTLQEFRANLAQWGSLAEDLVSLADVDTVDELKLLAREFHSQASLSPAHERLHVFLRNV